MNEVRKKVPSVNRSLLYVVFVAEVMPTAAVKESSRPEYIRNSL